jgi:hypothetical protein
MSSPPDLRQDAFISYNHDNNLLRDPDGNGWVDNFHQHLEVHLLQFAGKKVAIWRDPQMSGNAVIRKTLKDKIKDAVALVAILSPGYVNSKWCMSELREFCALAEEELGGLYPNGKSRILVVVKIPPDGGAYPAEIADQMRYEFFEINSKTKRPDEFRADMRNRDERYWLKLQEVAWDLKELLKELGRLSCPASAETNLFDAESSSAPTKTIYLAETTADLAEQRRQIKEELILHGYNVLPKETFPYVLEDYSKEVKNNLAEAEASINLLGRTYGIIPEGADCSILRLQLELANECAKTRSGFKRLIWTPEGWDASDAKLEQLLDQLKRLADPHKGVEFLQTSLEEFKTLMHKRLTASVNGHQITTTTTSSDDHVPKVYVICDRRDVCDAKPLIAYLQERGYEVVLPEFEEIEGETPLAEIHQQYLLECDGVIVYYGHGSQRWANAKRSDIEKHAGLEKTKEAARVRPLRAKAFYVTTPFDDLKDVYKPRTGLLIKNYGDFDPNLLRDFISDLEAGNDNQGGNDND